MKEIFNVSGSTVAYDHCIGCGLCEASCPHNAIDMKYNIFKEIVPNINDNCTKCKICIEYCPHTEDKIINGMQEAIDYNNPYMYGIDNHEVYIAYDKDIELRKKSASGGALSAFLKDLMNNNIVDYVIHASMVESSLGEQHYQAIISTTIEEIDKNRSSFYSPISFEKVIKTFKNTSHKLIIVGVPCVTRGVKKLFTTNKFYKNNTIYTAALACSHNVNGQFVDYLAQSEKIDNTTKFKVNLRNKDDIKDANHFKNHFFNDSYNGQQQTILKKDRFKTQFTHTWRNYYFAQNICFKCSDFWGVDADLSVKDAWGKWANKEPLGTSIVILRNDFLRNIFLQSNNIFCEKISYFEKERLQRQTCIFKHDDIKERITKKPFSVANIQNGYFSKYLISKVSKFLYKTFDYKKTDFFMKFFYKLLELFDNIFKSKIFKVFNYKKPYAMHRIYIMGGYGYDNTGDEAQLNTILKNLNHYFPDYFKIVGTHNRMSTYKRHKHSTLFDSSREAFFDHNSSKIYKLQNKIDFFQFFSSFILIYLNSFLVRAELPTFFINAKKAALLNELKNCDLLFFSGGGYLTGDTVSRLYDGILMIYIAKIFDIKVVMTGQTIGIWKNKFNMFLAKQAFSKVDLITTRDPKDSIKELKKVGVQGDFISYSCDDALFCDVADNISNELKKSNYNSLEKYITFNIHYWGMNSTFEKQSYLEKINKIVCYLIDNTKYNIMFIPMTKTDELAIKDLFKINISKRLYMFKYNYDFKVVRKVIKESELCITMKHHPIIFALGERVPVISLYYTEYYRHKNSGAMGLFEAEKFNLNLDDVEFLEQFINKFNYINQNPQALKNFYKNKLSNIYEKQKATYVKIQKLLGIYYG